jgi:predicted  nucleic acid-binding Zn-ribbon protein
MNTAAAILRRLRKLAQCDAQLQKVPAGTKANRRLQVMIESLRMPLPTSILNHYDLCKSRGEASIAPVRHGVCGVCHISLPRARLADLSGRPAEINVCDSCGVFIYLEEAEAARHRRSAGQPMAKRKTTEVKPTSASRRQPAR